MAATRLSLYNDALLLCGERALSSLTEEREPRRLLDQVWNNDGVIHCLEQAQWHFAMRTIQIDYDPDVAPDFGYRRAFVKPTDWVLTSALCSDEFFRMPLTQYSDEAGYWYSDLDTVYVRYVSSDESYGQNLAGWPRSFAEFVAAHLASKIVLKTTSDAEKLNVVLRVRQKSLDEARNRSAMASSTSFPAQGSWTLSRRRFGSRRDGGNNGSLIG